MCLAHFIKCVYWDNCSTHKCVDVTPAMLAHFIKNQNEKLDYKRSMKNLITKDQQKTWVQKINEKLDYKRSMKNLTTKDQQKTWLQKINEKLNYKDQIHKLEYKCFTDEDALPIG